MDINKNLLDHLYKLKYDYLIDFTDLYNPNYQDLEILESNASNLLQDLDILLQYIEEEYDKINI